LAALNDPADDEIVTADSLTIDFRSAFRADVALGFPPTTYDVGIGVIALKLHVDAGTLFVTHGLATGPASSGARLELEADSRICAVLSGALSAENALLAGAVRLRAGDPALLDRFARTFHLDGAPLIDDPVSGSRLRS